MTASRQVWIDTEVGDVGIVFAFGDWGMGLVVSNCVSRKDFNRLVKGIGWPKLEGLEGPDNGPVFVMSRKPRFLWRKVAGISKESSFQGHKVTSG